MATNTQGQPKGYHTVTPSLVVAGAAKAIDFYKKALGAEELYRFPAPDGTIMHAEILIGDTRLMLGDEMPEQGGKSPKTIGGTPVSFEDQFWGDRAGCFQDPFGHQWWLAQHVKDMTPEELSKAAESFFSQMQPAS